MATESSTAHAVQTPQCTRMVERGGLIGDVRRPRVLANDCERRNAPAGNGGGVVVTTGADMKPKRGWPLGKTYAGAPASTGGVVPTLSASSLSSTEVLYCKGNSWGGACAAQNGWVTWKGTIESICYRYLESIQIDLLAKLLTVKIVSAAQQPA